MSGCGHPAGSDGVCLVHAEAAWLRSERRSRAVTALDLGAVLADLALRQEFETLRSRWFEAGAVVSEQRGTARMPLDEAHAALDCCARLAAVILETDTALLEGRSPSPLLEATRTVVWERFLALDGGLRGTGALRPELPR